MSAEAPQTASTTPLTSWAQARIYGARTTEEGANYQLAVDWKSAEGSALSLHTVEDGAQFEDIISDSWCRSPL